MAAGRAYSAGESVEASKDVVTWDGVAIAKGTPGTVTHNSSAQSATLRVKFRGVGGNFRVVPKNCVKP